MSIYSVITRVLIARAQVRPEQDNIRTCPEAHESFASLNIYELENTSLHVQWEDLYVRSSEARKHKY